jgi:DNA-binding MarR family transcriptional regulator
MKGYTKRSRYQLQHTVSSMIRSGKYSSASDIARVLNITRSSVSDSIKRAVVNGLISLEEVIQSLPNTFSLAEKFDGRQSDNGRPFHGVVKDVVRCIKSKSHLTVRSIADSLGVSLSNVSRAIRRAIIYGYISIEECKEQLPLLRFYVKQPVS